MKVQIDLVSGRIDESTLSRDQLTKLLEGDHAVNFTCFNAPRYYANPASFRQITEPAPSLLNIFVRPLSKASLELFDGKYRPLSNYGWQHGAWDPTQDDQQSVSGMGLFRKWQDCEFVEK